jgi:hypothetical protein
MSALSCGLRILLCKQTRNIERQQENALQQSVCEQMCTCQGLYLPPVTYLRRPEKYRRYLYGNGPTKA